MLQNNLKTYTHKLSNHPHFSHSIYSIQHATIITSSHVHHTLSTSPNILYSHHTNRLFSILKRSTPAIDPNTPTIVSESSNTPITIKPNTDALTTGNEQHIEVHAFRSLITIAPEPDNININDLSLSFTERKAALYQKKNQQRMTTMEEADENIESMGKWSPPAAYEIWHEPPEVYDRIYGFDSDCEPPDRHNISWKWLYKLWGYYSEREVRYRCALYTYMKAQRRCMNEVFWEIFELENTFRVELQLLCLHIWFAKIKMTDGWGLHKGHKLCYKTFKIFFEQLPNRFGQHLSGSKSRWEQDCQQACLHFAVSLDHAKEDYESGDKQAYAKVIWNELYLSNRDMQHDLLYLWTDYILQELDNLDKVSNNEFINGWWKFGKIPTIESRGTVRQRIIDEFEKDDVEESEGDEEVIAKSVKD